MGRALQLGSVQPGGSVPAGGHAQGTSSQLGWGDRRWSRRRCRQLETVSECQRGRICEGRGAAEIWTGPQGLCRIPELPMAQASSLERRPQKAGAGLLERTQAADTWHSHQPGWEHLVVPTHEVRSCGHLRPIFNLYRNLRDPEEPKQS